MDYIPPYVDMTTPNIAEDNLTPDLTRVCPICFDKWTGIAAQLIYHILQNHSEYLINPEDIDRTDTEIDFTDYTFILLDNTYQLEEKNFFFKKTDEIVKIFIEQEKIFVTAIQQLPEGDDFHCGFNVIVNYIGPYLTNIDCMKFTCIVQYDLNNKKCLTCISDVVGETARLIIDDDIKELKKTMSHWPPVLIKVQVSVPKKFQALVNAMKNRLTCFKCNVMLRPPITNCRYGHIICETCRQKLQSRPICPTCYNNSIAFDTAVVNSTGQQHVMLQPAMQLQNKQTFCNNSSTMANENLGTGDILRNKTVKLNMAKEDLQSEFGQLRLLEEDALQVVYRCDKEDCNIWISYLDLEAHKNEFH